MLSQAKKTTVIPLSCFTLKEKIKNIKSPSSSSVKNMYTAIKRDLLDKLWGSFVYVIMYNACTLQKPVLGDTEIPYCRVVTVVLSVPADYLSAFLKPRGTQIL